MNSISVIVPVFGVERYVERFAHSLFGQSMKENVEFVFIDDCTPDKSIDILYKTLSKYPCRKSQVRIVKMPSNSGQAAVRRHGLQLADGEYVMCLDSDDYMDRTMLEDMYSYAKYGNYDIVISDYIFETSQKHELRRQHPDCLTGKECMNQILEMRMHGAWWNKLIKRELLERNPIRYPEARRDMLEDLMVTTQVLYYAANIGYLNKAYYHYCQNSGSVSKTISEAKVASMLYAYTLMEDFYTRNYINDVRSLNALRNFRISTLSAAALNAHGTSLITNFFQYRHLLPYILIHPRLSASFKLALFFQILHLKFMVELLIWARKILR